MPAISSLQEAPSAILRPTSRRRGAALANDFVRPNVLVRWVFFLSVLAIPFARVYLPGTGDRVGVTRLVQLLIFGAVLSQPRVCLRFIPSALLWFAGYCALQILTGLWLTPELRAAWLPRTLDWLQFALPWLWILFNVMQFPKQTRNGLWALVLGCSLCAVLHVVGIGVEEIDQGLEGRSSVFDQNANSIGATYAIALIVLVALMFGTPQPSRWLLFFPLIAVLGIALAKTGSRGSALMLALGIGVLFFQSKSLRSRTKRLATLLLIAGVLGGVAWQIPTVTKRFEQLDASNLDRQEGRVRMMPVLWDIISRSPVYGSGPAGYEFELTRRAMPHMVKDQRTTTAHNLALKLLVETGIVGLLLFAAGVKPAFAAAWRQKSSEALPLALLLPLLAAGVTVGDSSSLLVFWFAIAYGLAGGKTC